MYNDTLFFQPYRTPRTTPKTAADQAKLTKLAEQKKKISYLKGIESKLANLIMDEVLER
jgi:hypothetical protein